MNERFYKQLKEINTTVLRNMEFLLEEQEIQIKKAIEENIVPDGSYKEKPQSALDKFSEDIKEIRKRVSYANINASELYSIVEEASNFALEVSEEIGRALKKLDSMIKSIEDERLNSFNPSSPPSPPNLPSHRHYSPT